MSYTIKRYGQPNIILPNGAINTETSVTLIGKNYASYGQMLDQNSMTLLQNSASDTPPLNPQYGQLWYDASTRTLRVYTGTAFKSLGSLVASTAAPSNASIGDLWFNTTDETLNVYNGTSWVVIGPTVVRGTGTIATTILDTTNVTHFVVEILVGQAIVGIISKDPVFVPASPIPGFQTIGPGYNMASSVSTVQQYFQGTSTNSLQLGGQAANAYMLSSGSSNRVDFTGGLYANFIYADQYQGNIVTAVNTGAGLTGGPITSTGTISLTSAVQQTGGIGGNIGGVIPDGETIVISNSIISAVSGAIGKPIIQGFSPTSGTVSGGTIIFVTGSYFTGASSVTVAGVPAAHFSVTSGTQMVVVTGSTSLATSGPITVTTPGGTSSSTANFSYAVVPTISNFRPISSPITGGTVVFVEGTNLVNVSAVTLAGVPVQSYTAHTPQLISALSAPTANTVSGPIKVVTGAGTVYSEEIFDYTTVDNTPTIDNISPTTGPVAGGTTITITGTNLSTVFAVTVDGIQAQQVTHISDTQVQCVTAPGIAGSGEVMVYSVYGVAMSTQHFTYASTTNAPTISFIAPIAGPLAGGTAVTIAGTNLNSVTSVMIAGVNAASFSIASPTQIIAITGQATQAGAGYVQLQSPLGSTISSMAYTYYNNASEPVISHIAPSVGPLGGGTQLLIQGQNYQTGLGTGVINSVIVASIAAVQVSVTSNTSLTAVTSAVGAATTGRVLISGVYGSATSAQLFTYDAIPVITSFSPTTGPISGNSPIIVVGTDLTGVTAATVVGTAVSGANVSVVSDSVVEVVSPPHAAGSGIITLQNLAGNGASSQTYTYSTSPQGTVTSVAVGAGLVSSTSPNPITSSGTIYLAKAVQQVAGTGGTLGGVIPDGLTITVNSSGVISAGAVATQVQSLGVGTAPSGTIGEIRATNNITAFYSSDERLKENFQRIEDPLERAKAIRGYFYDWTEAFIEQHGGEDGVFIRKHNVGLKAQEVQKVMPEVVAERDDGYLAVRYEMLVPLLFECVNALIDKLDSK